MSTVVRRFLGSLSRQTLISPVMMVGLCMSIICSRLSMISCRLAPSDLMNISLDELRFLCDIFKRPRKDVSPVDVNGVNGCLTELSDLVVVLLDILLVLKVALAIRDKTTSIPHAGKVGCVAATQPILKYFDGLLYFSQCKVLQN